MTQYELTDGGDLDKEMRELLGELEAMLDGKRESGTEALGELTESDEEALHDLTEADAVVEGRDVFHWSAKALAMSKPLLIALRTLPDDEPWRLKIEEALDRARAGDIVALAQWAVECATNAEPTDKRDAESAEVALVAMLSLVLIAQERVGSVLITKNDIQPPHQFSAN